MHAVLAIAGCAVLALFPASSLGAETSRPADPAPALPHGLDWGIGGLGGVYFFPEPGEMVIEVARRDRNRSGRPSELRAILFGPDRQVLAHEIIPDDRHTPRRLGPLGSVTLRTRVERRGAYGLNITTSQDRYGEQLLWGFRTNCARYILETSRAHRDARHVEPIVLMRPDRAMDVAFVPRAGAFQVQLTGLPPDSGDIALHDDTGRAVALLQRAEDGSASHRVRADRSRAQSPWRLHLPKGQATIEIEGVTSWESGDASEHMALWSPDPASWFPLLENRWLLQPYRHLACGRPGTRGRFTYTVHNNSAREQKVKLELEHPGPPWEVEIPERSLALPAGAKASVIVEYTVPPAGAECVVHLRATPDAGAFTTYSTLTVRGGSAPASQPLELPVVLQPYTHENALFGYAPDYPLDNQVYFDLENRPFVRLATGIATRRDQQWERVEFTPETVQLEPPLQKVPRAIASSKIAFDADNDVYVLAAADNQAALLHSSDAGRSFRAYPIIGSQNRAASFDLEQFSGHNVPTGPPAFVRYTRKDEPGRLDKGTDRAVFWRRENALDLFVPRKQDGRIIIGEPIRLSEMGLGVSLHSGPASTIVSRGDRVHVCWGEATDPKVEVAGVPAYVASYDRRSGRLGAPALIGHGPPPNDVHNTPSITIDGNGFLHAVVGTHNRPFLYARSLQPDTAHDGWTEAAPISEGVRQTYVGLVCGPDGTLHLVFRMWRDSEQPFPASSHARLAWQRKPPGEEWQAPVSLVVPALPEYSVYYHRLTIDRKGALFLSYDYWSTFWFYRNDQPVRTRAVLTSADGAQWRFWLPAEATTSE